MQGRGSRILSILAFEIAPATIFGGSSVFAAAALTGSGQLDLLPIGAGAAGFFASFVTLRLFGGRAERQHDIPEFEPQQLEVEQSSLSELLTQADVAALVDQLAGRRAIDEADEDGARCATEELELDDVLKAVEADSRVVRLFEPDGTPGEMHSRIERHLRETPRTSVQNDATQELHDALAALRQSLR